MDKVVIKVDNVGKQYRLGQVGTGTIMHDVNRWWYRMRGKDDPYLKIGEVNDRTIKGSSDLVWALKDINFEVKQGEVLGIIGKNGAGKSTLLKILSRVTSPTIGDVKIKGRIASLLEVGTGFHPELTGRENVFLNGAILGMTKKEISSKFDEIVDFSGVERYIDTPVKRYSSGMYVRLAFAVAAHLEPEILIVDEVLAVGDAEFQKKCMGKMKDVSGQGRTILFVSHNMPSIRLLCNTCAFMERGTLRSIGETDKIIAEYLSDSRVEGIHSDEIPPDLSLHNSGEAKFKRAYILNRNKEKVKEFGFTEKLKIEFEMDVVKDIPEAALAVHIVNGFGERVMMINESDQFKPISVSRGSYHFAIDLNEELMPGNYSLCFSIAHYHTGSAIDFVESFYPFIVTKESKEKNFEYPWATVHGYVKPQAKWTIIKL
jgi:lipopolysaccharide transport system ATP-binding protein